MARPTQSCTFLPLPEGARCWTIRTTDVACAPNTMGSCTASTVSFSSISLPAGSYYLIVGASNTGAYTLTVSQ